MVNKNICFSNLNIDCIWNLYIIWNLNLIGLLNRYGNYWDHKCENP